MVFGLGFLNIPLKISGALFFRNERCRLAVSVQISEFRLIITMEQKFYIRIIYKTIYKLICIIDRIILAPRKVLEGAPIRGYYGRYRIEKKRSKTCH